jgi:transposase
MASKKRRKKASKKVVKKRRKKTSTSLRVVRVAKSSPAELSLLHNIEKKVTRIDRTVNAGHHLARKARKAKRRASIERDWEDIERHGME